MTQQEICQIHLMSSSETDQSIFIFDKKTFFQQIMRKRLKECLLFFQNKKD